MLDRVAVRSSNASPNALKTIYSAAMSIIFIANAATAPLAEKFGRKWMLLISGIFTLLSYVLMLIAREVWVIVVARFIQGISSGIVLSSQPMYLAEISTDNVRGATGSLMQLFLVSGALYSYAIGPFVSYHAFQWFCLATPIVFAVIFLFMPETPYFYAAKGRQEEATKSLQFLRGQSAEGVQNELANIQAEIAKSRAHKATVAEVFTNPGNRKALIITSTLLVFQQLTGNTAVLFNMQTIFESANTGFDPAIETIIIGLVQVIASCITPLIVDRLGRKLILLFSAVGLSITLAALGAFFYVKIVVGDSSSLLWIPVPALVIYIILYSISFGSLPWVILGEMFPVNVKSIAGSIVSTCCFITFFIIIFLYPYLVALGSYYIFWLFAISCALAFFFTLFMVIETKELSLQQIQDRLQVKHD